MLHTHLMFDIKAEALPHVSKQQGAREASRRELPP
jgi:hypothetical protein